MLFNTIQIQPLPNKRKEVELTLISVAEKIRHFKGCLSYRVCLDLEEKNTLCVIEQWESENDLRDFLESELGTVLKGSMDLLAESTHQQFNIVYSFDSLEDR